MPNVGGVNYPYTPQGMAEARRAAANLGQTVPGYQGGGYAGGVGQNVLVPYNPELGTVPYNPELGTAPYAPGGLSGSAPLTNVSAPFDLELFPPLTNVSAPVAPELFSSPTNFSMGEGENLAPLALSGLPLQRSLSGGGADYFSGENQAAMDSAGHVHNWGDFLSAAATAVVPGAAIPELVKMVASEYFGEYDTGSWQPESGLEPHDHYDVTGPGNMNPAGPSQATPGFPGHAGAMAKAQAAAAAAAVSAGDAAVV